VGVSQRPREISRFERLALAACSLDVIATLVALHLARQGIVSAVFGTVIAGFLILGVSRRRSLIGRILVTIWLLLGLVADIASYALILASGYIGNTNPLLLALSLSGFAFNGSALFFLWKSASTAWLRTKPT
jgi:hypothetical protein